MWFKIPLKYRALSFLVLLVLSSISFIWQNLLYLIPSTLFFIVGLIVHAFHLKKMHIKILGVLILFIFYSIMLNVSQSKSVLGIMEFSSSMFFSLITILVLTQGIRVEEWLIILHKSPLLLKSIIIALSSGWSSMVIDLNNTLLTLKLSNSQNWGAKKSIPNKLSTKLEFYFYFAFNLGDMIYKTFINWTKKTIEFTYSSEIKPNEIYYLNYFTTMYDKIFLSNSICESWRCILEKYLVSKQNILEIGAGSGKLTNWLLENNYHLTESLEPNKDFVAIANERLSKHNFKIRNENFPPIQNATKKYDAIVMHQNVFLELTNETSILSIINSFKNLLVPNAILIFDYPVQPVIPPKNDYINLFHGPLDGIGEIKYGYEYLGSSSENKYSVLLKYEVLEHNRIKFSSNNVMSIFYPPIEEIINSIQCANFIVRENEETSYYSFFSLKLNILVFELNGS